MSKFFFLLSCVFISSASFAKSWTYTSIAKDISPDRVIDLSALSEERLTQLLSNTSANLEPCRLYFVNYGPKDEFRGRWFAGIFRAENAPRDNWPTFDAISSRNEKYKLISYMNTRFLAADSRLDLETICLE